MSRDRDRTLEQALTHELRAAGAPDRDTCVDAETLGAWADGGLDGAQMAAVELHVSTCARCLAIVGATARSAHRGPGTETTGPSFLWRWWLAPLAATAAAVTLWMVVPHQRDIAVGPSSVITPATETFARNQPKTEAVPTEPSPAKSADARDALADRARHADTPQQTRASRQERAYSEKKEESRPANKDQDAQKPLQEQIANARNAAPAAAPPSAPAAAELRKSAGLASAPAEIASPVPSSRWRIVNGAVEHSQDGGASWIATRLQAGDSITGGTAPAQSICWLIGPSGLVMVTSDGLTFARVPLPERVDLAAVTASDALTAVVTTVDGRRFRTDDAGRTWRRN
jgi:hypothetical protein